MKKFTVLFLAVIFSSGCGADTTETTTTETTTTVAPTSTKTITTVAPTTTETTTTEIMTQETTLSFFERAANIQPIKVKESTITNPVTPGVKHLTQIPTEEEQQEQLNVDLYNSVKNSGMSENLREEYKSNIKDNLATYVDIYENAYDYTDKYQKYAAGQAYMDTQVALAKAYREGGNINEALEAFIDADYALAQEIYDEKHSNSD